MCTRINNIMAALTFLEVYHRRLGNMFAVYGDWSVRQKVDCMSVNSMDMVKSGKLNPFSSFLVSHNFCHLLLTFANSLNPDQDQQNVGPDLDPNCLTVWCS